MKFIPTGMRTSIKDPNALIINTCGKNDLSERGDETTWAWCNPTNRAILHPYEDIQAVSVECLWQATKIRSGETRPREEVLNGNWRLNKGKRPIGAYAGPDQPLITTPGEARRRIYIPAFKRLIEHWLEQPEIQATLERARKHNGPVYLRDFDTGQGIDRNGPMSHAWVFSVWLNTGNWPT